ncbi:MAG: DUF58 domain-containing protein [Chloroflexi bacterium]|nr:DUF58 domain-containing protein [Chloroflexota bacterium]
MQNRRIAIYILLIPCLLVGLFTGRAFFFNLAYLLGALLVVSLIWSWLSVRWIGISRRTRTRRAQVGRTLEESFTVQNRAILPKLWLEIRDHSDLPGHRASHVVPALGARARYRWNVETICQVRGQFQLGPMTIVSGDPFGLFLAPRRLGATSHVIVYPQVVPVPRFELPMGQLSGGEAQRRRTQYVTTNAAGVREYAYGDSFNRIHWPTSARKSRLMVKEFEIDPLVDIWILVDFSKAALVEAPSVRRINGDGPVVPSGELIPASTEEYAVVIAASLTQHFIETERALGFVGYCPDREIHQPERGHRQLTHILETLAVARSLSGYTLAQMVMLEMPYLTRGTTIIVITASLDEAWISEAQILARKGVRPVCILIDPASFGAPVNIEDTRAMLRLAKIPTLVVQYGADLSRTLTQPLT